MTADLGPRLPWRALVGVVVVLVLVFAVVGGLARAADTPLALQGSFGGSGSGDGQFAAPYGVAVDPSSGDVYVADSFNDRVEKFGPAGTYLSQFGSSGTDDGQFNLPLEIAVDPSNGDVYVSDDVNNRVEKFDSSGKYLLQFGSSGSGNGQFTNVFGVGVDPSSGDVYVVDEGGNRVEKFDSSGNYLSQFGSSGSGNGQFSSPWGLAVNPSSGDVYVTDTGNSRVEEFDSSGNYLAQFNGSDSPGGAFSDPIGVAIDSTNSNVYVSDGGSERVVTFASSGTYVSEYDNASANLRFDAAGAGGTVYVSDGTVVDILAPGVPAAPSVGGGSETASSVTADSATIGASVDAKGADTTYYFEYVDDAHYNPSASDPYSAGTQIPAPPGADIGSAFSIQNVTANLTGLSESTTYHFRVVASNSLGTTDGTDQTFTTVTPVAPSVDAESASGVMPTSATLNAQINPGFGDTSYYFQYVDARQYDRRSSNPWRVAVDVPVPPGTDIGSADTDQTASVTVENLHPGDTYDFRVVARNAVGTTYGSKRSFTAIAQVTLTGKFGQATIDMAAAGISDLRLRNPDGSLPSTSLISSAGTSVNDAATGAGFASTQVTPGRVIIEKDHHGAVTAVIMKRIWMIPGTEEETWTIAETDGGRSLKWTIAQHWVKAFTGNSEATPGLQFTRDILGTWWYNPTSVYASQWDSSPANEFWTSDFGDEITKPNTWLIEKLVSRYHLGSDLRMAVDGGYLWRTAGLSETALSLGATPDSTASPATGHSFSEPAGTNRQITLTLAGVNKAATGEQLDVSIPDKKTESSLRDMYESMLNGGSIAGQKGYLFGNGVADAMSPYSAQMEGIAAAVGLPTGEQAAQDPYSVQQAVRGYLEAELNSIDDNGFMRYGLAGLGYQDSVYYVLIGLYNYTVATGDLSLARQYWTQVEDVLALWMGRVQSNGLVLSYSSDGSYYDTDGSFFGSSYYSLYNNNYVYEDLVDMAALAKVLAANDPSAGSKSTLTSGATTYLASAATIKNGINSVLWDPSGPYGPMYIDWINLDNSQPDYVFMAAGQYQAVNFGIASRAQGEELLKTADARIAQISAPTFTEAYTHPYSGACTPGFLWPVDPSVPLLYGNSYGNGGCLLMETSYEINARALLDDTTTAYQRLQKFAAQWDKTSFWGSNWINLNGTTGDFLGYESYLADMVLTPTSLVRGIMGINQTWNGLVVTPHLPASWPGASASIMDRGHVICVQIKNGKTPKVTQHAGRCQGDPGDSYIAEAARVTHSRPSVARPEAIPTGRDHRRIRPRNKIVP